MYWISKLLNLYFLKPFSINYFNFSIHLASPIRLYSLDTESVPNTGYRPLYTMMSTLRLLAALHTDGPLCGLWPYYKLIGRFTAHLRYLVSIQNLVNFTNIVIQIRFLLFWAMHIVIFNLRGNNITWISIVFLCN